MFDAKLAEQKARDKAKAATASASLLTAALFTQASLLLYVTL